MADSQSIQHLGFGNIRYDTKGLSPQQLACAAACDKPLPRTQDEIVECLKTCGVSNIYEEKSEHQPKVEANNVSAKFSLDDNKRKILLLGGAALLVLFLLNKRR